MKVKNKSGFTLIELLVVITIIGILATGATAIYTSQIQKARDTTRINDMKAMQIAVEQVYQDRGEYPPTSNYFIVDGTAVNPGVSVKTYMPKIPKDPKNGQTCNNGGTANTPTCVYAYYSDIDDNGINRGAYALTTALESEGKLKSDGQNDGGVLNTRWEVGSSLSLKAPKSTFNVNYNSGASTDYKTMTGVKLIDLDGNAPTDAVDNWDVQGKTIIISGE